MKRSVLPLACLLQLNLKFIHNAKHKKCESTPTLFNTEYLLSLCSLLTLELPINNCRLLCHLLVIFKVIFANCVDPGQEQSDQGPHCLLYAKIGLKSLQEYSADDINRRHFQMQIFLAF